MWCPEGYLSYSDFEAICYEAGQKLFPYDDYFAEQRKDNWARHKISEDPSIRALATTDWLKIQCLGSDIVEKTICSPRGERLKVTGLFFSEIPWPDKADPWQIYPKDSDFEEIRSFILAQFSAPSPWVSLSVNGEVRCPSFLKMVMYDVRNLFKRSAFPIIFPRLTYVRRNVAPFVGWRVCFDKATFPASSQELIALFADRLTKPSEEETRNNDFRHRGKQDEIRALIALHFPKGIQDVSAKNLQRALEGHFNKLPHLDTIRRAVGRKK
ncbi:hypothetical protein AB4874_12695 [Thioclava sp. 15-R06ZXC-3]|uniref:Uncharacterized protein n=1 Tax=Thioclava arctica TaxID=3238301 RepID=A0ABV3TP12_9RHOB